MSVSRFISSFFAQSWRLPSWGVSNCYEDDTIPKHFDSPEKFIIRSVRLAFGARSLENCFCSDFSAEFFQPMSSITGTTQPKFLSSIPATCSLPCLVQTHWTLSANIRTEASLDFYVNMELSGHKLWCIFCAAARTRTYLRLPTLLERAGIWTESSETCHSSVFLRIRETQMIPASPVWSTLWLFIAAPNHFPAEKNWFRTFSRRVTFHRIMMIRATAGRSELGELISGSILEQLTALWITARAQHFGWCGGITREYHGEVGIFTRRG